MQSGSMPPKSERRAHPRQKIQSLTYVELGNGNGGIALNVSEGGMTVVAAQPLDAEGTLDVALQVPQTRKRLELKGEVRWLSDSRKEAGLQFVNLSSEALTDIRDWMAREASPQPVDETFRPMPTYREPSRPSADESFFADEDEVEQQVEEQIEEQTEVQTEERTEEQTAELTKEPAKEQTEVETIQARAAVENEAAVKAREPETTAKKLERVFEAGHREMEVEAAATETFTLEPLTPGHAARANGEVVEAPTTPGVNGARRTPFSTLASELPGAAPTQPASALEASSLREFEDDRGLLSAQSPSTLISSPPHPLELPRPVFGSSYQTSQEIPEETGKDIRVHLQSGWVLGVLLVLLALISFFSGMAVRRGALNRMVGDNEQGGARTSSALTPSAAPTTQNSAAATTSSVPTRQVDIEVVDSANRKWTIPMSAGGTVAPPTATAPETSTPTQPANDAASTAAPAKSQPQPSAANPPVAPTPSANNTRTTSNTDLSDATTSDNGNGGLMMTLPETPVAASSSIAISVRRFIPIPPDAAARNRNLQVGSLANLVEPAYPAEAVQAKVDGTVKLRATISADGSIGYLDAESGPRALLPNSLTAVRNWRYAPTLLNGRPIETQEEITIVFRLPR
jgi:outer membrane biosynthesis protein TonB